MTLSNLCMSARDCHWSLMTGCRRNDQNSYKWPETLMLAACWHCSGYWAAVGAHWLLMKDSIVRLGGAHAVATWRPRHTCPVLSIHVIMFLGHVTRIQRLEILRSLSLWDRSCRRRVSVWWRCRHSRLSRHCRHLPCSAAGHRIARLSAARPTKTQ